VAPYGSFVSFGPMFMVPPSKDWADHHAYDLYHHAGPACWLIARCGVCGGGSDARGNRRCGPGWPRAPGLITPVCLCGRPRERLRWGLPALHDEAYASALVIRRNMKPWSLRLLP